MVFWNAVKTAVSKVINVFKPKDVPAPVSNVTISKPSSPLNNAPIKKEWYTEDVTALRNAIGPALTATVLANPAVVNTVVQKSIAAAPKVIKESKSLATKYLNQPLKTQGR